MGVLGQMFPLTFSACALAVGFSAPGVLFGVGIDEGSPGETVVSPSGEHVAFVLSAKVEDVLYVDGREVAREEALDQVSVLDSGQAVFWHKKGDEQWVRLWDGTSVGPFADVGIPDVEVLASLGEPVPQEWGYRGGTRVAFAARDGTGEWVALLRFPGVPEIQEKRPLPVMRAIRTSPDPTVEDARPLRYRLIRGLVPIFVGVRKKGGDECLFVGREEAGCGERIEMLAWSSKSGRTAHAVRTRQGLVVNTGLSRLGPTGKVDWISFSPDGSRLAMVIREGGSDVLVVDDVKVEAADAIEPAVWTRDGRLAYVVHDAKGAHLRVGDATVFEKDVISSVLVSPSGEVLAVGQDSSGLYLHPFGPLEGVESLWAEGFLSNGFFFGAARLKGGRQGLVLGGKVHGSWNSLSRLLPAPDGHALAAVGSSVEGDVVLLDGEEWKSPGGRIDRLDWCRGSSPVAVASGPDQACVIVEQGEFCCGAPTSHESRITNHEPRITSHESPATGPVGLVAAACSDDSPLMVCMQSGEYVLLRSGKRLLEAFDEVPLQLVYQDSANGRLDFAARRGAEWFIVTNGAEQSAAGKVAFVYPAPDGPWFRVEGKKGVRWWTPDGPGAFYAGVSLPVFVAGKGLYRARKDGREGWVRGGKELFWADRLVSSPIERNGKVLFWAVESGKLALYELPAEANGPANETGVP